MFPEADDGEADEFFLTIVVDDVVFQFAVGGLLGLAEAEVKDIGFGIIVQPEWCGRIWRGRPMAWGGRRRKGCWRRWGLLTSG